MLTTAKHFPGHGDTHQDSHDSLPVVSRTLDELRQCELQPFQAAIDAGVSLVMTAHVAFPKIDPKVCPIHNDEKFVLDLLLAEKLLIVQGTAFNWPWPDHFRVVTLPRVDDLEQAIGRIGNFLKSYRQ